MELYTDVAGSHLTTTPVLMIHGLGASSNFWGPQSMALSRYHPVYCPDLRGSGRSRRAALASIEDMVADMIELLDLHKIATAHIASHSLGCVVAQHLAVSHPQRVQSLIMLGPLYESRNPKALTDRAANVRAGGLTEVANITVQNGTSARTKAAQPEVAAFVRELVMSQDPEGYAQLCDAIAAIRPARIETLTTPTLVITGDEDMTSPPAVARAIAARIPNADFHLLARCGHWAALEQSQTVSHLMMQFILDNPTTSKA